MKRYFPILFFICMLTGDTDAQQKKNTAAVLDLVNSGGVDKNEIQILTNRLSNYLVNVGVYKILEREKMAAILKEQDFTMSDNCNSSECAIQIGQLLGVERMITGTVGKFGQVWTLDARVVDVATGEVLKTQSENYKGEKEGLLDVIEGIAYTLCGKIAPTRSATKTTDQSSTSVAVTGKSTTESGQDEIKIGTVSKQYGSLEISNEIDGTLYIDDKWIGQVTGGSLIPIHKLRIGNRIIKIVYSGGEFTEIVAIENNQTAKITARQKTKLTSTQNSFTDSRDGKTYKIVKIGNQIWMAENLNYVTSSGSKCYDNNPSNCEKYGRLYDWETAKKVAPAGWHLPSKEEWETLLKNLGGSGLEAYKQMASGGSSGFTALLSGFGVPGGFSGIDDTSFWSSTTGSKKHWAWFCSVNSKYGATMDDFIFDKIYYSVRCLKD